MESLPNLCDGNMTTSSLLQTNDPLQRRLPGWLPVSECVSSVQDSSVGGDGHHLPRNKFSALLQCCLCGVFQPAAAGDLHPHDGHALDVVAADDLRQLLGVIHAVQLRAAKEMGYSFIQVKTVQMGKYKSYDDTNRFYLSIGFKEFEVFPTLWDEWNPCQIYVMGI